VYYYGVVDIRPASTRDFKQLQSLFLAFGSVNQDGLKARFLRIFESPDFCLLVAQTDKKIIGYALAQGYLPRLRSGDETVRLHDLMVASHVRRTGVGQALLEAVKDWCKVRGARYLEWQANLEATKFYHRLGYTPDPPQNDYPYFEIDFGTVKT
jgi:GNAT superfamily N-acetyltransferase